MGQGQGERVGGVGSEPGCKPARGRRSVAGAAADTPAAQCAACSSALHCSALLRGPPPMHHRLLTTCMHAPQRGRAPTWRMPLMEAAVCCARSKSTYMSWVGGGGGWVVAGEQRTWRSARLLRGCLIRGSSASCSCVNGVDTGGSRAAAAAAAAGREQQHRETPPPGAPPSQGAPHNSRRPPPAPWSPSGAPRRRGRASLVGEVRVRVGEGGRSRRRVGGWGPAGGVQSSCACHLIQPPLHAA